MLKGSFSFTVAKRILSVLEENGPTKKTNLATKSGLNYGICLKYINMLRFLGWIDVTHDKSTYISITGVGREVNERLFGDAALDVPPSPTTISRESRRVGNIDHILQSPERHVEASTDDKRPTGPSRSNEGQSKANIMIVDDEQDILLTYRVFLSNGKYNVDGFPDAYSALKKVASSAPSHYDLFILDIRIPEMNGLQLFQSLRAMTPSSKFLFVSSLDAAKELVTILPGVSQEQVLKKPVDRMYFIKSIESLLASC